MVAKKMICLFDVDGTLTKARQQINKDFWQQLKNLRLKGIPLGLVSGSDLAKVVEQLGGCMDEVLNGFDYVFTENGLVAHKGGKLHAKKTISQEVGDETLQDFINFCFEYMSKLRLPLKRGNFIEFRNGMLNVSPIGRSCSQAEREQFALYDKEHKIREKFVEAMKNNFTNCGLHFAIGGQISIDVFPVGWDKSFCLQYLLEDGYEDIHFFGDRTTPGGNDYEIFIDKRTVGHSVTCPEDTRKILDEMFSKI